MGNMGGTQILWVSYFCSERNPLVAYHFKEAFALAITLLTYNNPQKDDLQQKTADTPQDMQKRIREMPRTLKPAAQHLLLACCGPDEFTREYPTL